MSPSRYSAMVLLTLTPVFAGAQTTTDPATVSPLGLQQATDVGLGLVVVLVVIGVAAWVGKRFLGTTGVGTRHLRILSGLNLGTRDKIVLVQVGDEQLLVGVSPGRVQTLHVLKNPIAESVGAEHPGKFPAQLKQALRTAQGKSE